MDRALDPGGKRLVEHASVQCAVEPQAMAHQVEDSVMAVLSGEVLLTCLDVLVGELDAVLRAEGLIDSQVPGSL